MRCKALKSLYFGKIAQFRANELATLQLLEVLSSSFYIKTLKDSIRLLFETICDKL